MSPSHTYHLLQTPPAPHSKRNHHFHLRVRHLLLFLLPASVLTLLILDYLSHGEFTFYQWPLLNSTFSLQGSGRGGGLTFRDGLAVVSGNVEVHPVRQLIERARKKFLDMEGLKKRVNILDRAVEDYRREYGMNPPEGFENWFNFARSVNSTAVPSLLPSAHYSVLPYLSLPPDLLHNRVKDSVTERAVFGIMFYPEEDRVVYYMEDEIVGYMSTRGEIPSLLEPICRLIPPNQQPGEPMQLISCVKDGSCTLVSGEIMQRSMQLAQAGEIWDQEELLTAEDQSSTHRGWLETCPPHAVVFNQTANGERSFVDDFAQSMDFCRHPDLTRTNGEMIMESQNSMRPLTPMLSVSRVSNGADIMGPATRAVNDTHDYSPWSDKTRAQVVWRGSLTGVYHRERWDWRSSQRDRLVFLGAAHEDKEEVQVLFENGSGARKVREVAMSIGELVERWLDVGAVDDGFGVVCGMGPTGEACRIDHSHEIPCESRKACDEMYEEVKFVEKMENHDAVTYKYRLDVDGFGWSSRFRKLLSSNSLIIKATVYPEWWTTQLIPWYHLVPMKYDYTDLWDILAFFDDEANDRLAEDIAEQGRAFSVNQMRWEDMQSYMLLLLLEYRRAWADDRDKASFGGSVTIQSE